MIHNTMEEIVEQLLQQVQEEQPELFHCTCDKCMNDMRIYALNHLPARYYAREDGQTYTEFNNQDPQSAAHALGEVVKAVKKVQANPWHK